MNNETKFENFSNKIKCLRNDYIAEIETQITHLHHNVLSTSIQALQFNCPISLNSHIDDDSCTAIGLNIFGHNCVAVKLSNDELIQLKPLNYFSIETLHNILTKLYHNFNAFNIRENKYIDEIENF